ncbi:MAG: ComF family protein [Betaproteobacteria bacterium]|nr:ComF family protein [Betaproteobacteria bacterium]
MLIFNQKNCLLCGISTNQDFCNACFSNLPRLPDNHCPICLRAVISKSRCGVCIADPPKFTRTIAALRYAFPVDALIHALKYQANLPIAPILAKLLCQYIGTTQLPDLIIPMPLHPNRLKERGFNQALEISRYIAKQYNVPLLLDGCKRIKHTAPQMGLPWKSRHKNIRNAFACKVELSGMHVAVIDDVMTTGATLNELAKVLNKQGASEISNWIVSRALLDHRQTQSTTQF